MGRYLLIFSLLFFIGCETPQEKNKKEIEKLKQKVEKLEQVSYEIKNLQSQIDEIKNKQLIIKDSIDNNKILSKLAILDEKLKNIKTVDNSNIENQIKTLKQKSELLKEELTKLKSTTFDYIVIKPTTLITIDDVNIYSKPDKNSKVITAWSKKTTFTSYKEKNGFIKITGYFINGKWTPNKKDWWIQKEKCKIKIIGE